MWKEQQRKKLQSTPLSSEWKRIVETRCPFYHLLPEPDRTELEGHIQVFMAEKKFEGCGGLDLNDEIRVCIAAHACLLLLHRDADYYPGLKTILVYPNTYFAPTMRDGLTRIYERFTTEQRAQRAIALKFDSRLSACELAQAKLTRPPNATGHRAPNAN